MEVSFKMFTHKILNRDPNDEVLKAFRLLGDDVLARSRSRRCSWSLMSTTELRRQQGPAAVPHSPRLDRSFSRRHLQTGVIDRFLEGSSGSACSNGPTGKSREEEVRVRRSTTQACLPRPQNVEAAKLVIESKLRDETLKM